MKFQGFNPIANVWYNLNMEEFTMQVKHGGCQRCKTKDQEILKSVLLKGEVMGFALCDVCVNNARKKGTLIEKD